MPVNWLATGLDAFTAALPAARKPAPAVNPVAVVTFELNSHSTPKLVLGQAMAPETTR
jgi:hypothetical protein